VDSRHRTTKTAASAFASLSANASATASAVPSGVLVSGPFVSTTTRTTTTASTNMATPEANHTLLLHADDLPSPSASVGWVEQIFGQLADPSRQSRSVAEPVGHGAMSGRELIVQP